MISGTVWQESYLKNKSVLAVKWCSPYVKVRYDKVGTLPCLSLFLF